MTKIAKKLVIARKKVESKNFYTLEKAIKLTKEASYANFDESLDLAFKLNLDVKQADQQLRGVISLPHGTNKIVKVLVATDDDEKQKTSKKAGADIVVNSTKLIEILKSTKLNFDLIVTDPPMMPILSKFGKVLGPKGLMPNPKTGTVTLNLAETVKKIKKGQTNYRTDKEGIVHTMIGKISMDTTKLIENAKMVINKIIKLKPLVVKGTYLQNLTISSTMGPSIKILIEK